MMILRLQLFILLTFLLVTRLSVATELKSQAPAQSQVQGSQTPIDIYKLTKSPFVACEATILCSAKPLYAPRFHSSDSVPPQLTPEGLTLPQLAKESFTELLEQMKSQEGLTHELELCAITNAQAADEATLKKFVKSDTEKIFIASDHKLKNTKPSAKVCASAKKYISEILPTYINRAREELACAFDKSGTTADPYSLNDNLLYSLTDRTVQFKPFSSQEMIDLKKNWSSFLKEIRAQAETQYNSGYRKMNLDLATNTQTKEAYIKSQISIAVQNRRADCWQRYRKIVSTFPLVNHLSEENFSSQDLLAALNKNRRFQAILTSQLTDHKTKIEKTNKVTDEQLIFLQTATFERKLAREPQWCPLATAAADYIAAKAKQQQKNAHLAGIGTGLIGFIPGAGPLVSLFSRWAAMGIFVGYSGYEYSTAAERHEFIEKSWLAQVSNLGGEKESSPVNDAILERVQNEKAMAMFNFSMTTALAPVASTAVGGTVFTHAAAGTVGYKLGERSQEKAIQFTNGLKSDLNFVVDYMRSKSVD